MICWWLWLCLPVVTEEFSSSGDSKTEEDQEKRSPKDKESKDRDRDRDDGEYVHSYTSYFMFALKKESFWLRIGLNPKCFLKCIYIWNEESCDRIEKSKMQLQLKFIDISIQLLCSVGCDFHLWMVPCFWLAAFSVKDVKFLVSVHTMMRPS